MTAQRSSARRNSLAGFVLAATAIGLVDLAWHAGRAAPAAREVVVATAATLAVCALLGLAVALLARLVPRAMRAAPAWTACQAVYLGLALERPEVFERLEGLVQDLRIPLSTRPLDPRERAVLQSLGYAQ
ncbi:MAG TPA: hypothetical protein VMS76_15700 [Planctomycetota bacterium]|nr:hypothetical protein [Planctomycetota bacterium]